MLFMSLQLGSVCVLRAGCVTCKQVRLQQFVLSDRRRVSLRVLAQTAEMVTSAVTFSARRCVTEIFRDGRVKL